MHADAQRPPRSMLAKPLNTRTVAGSPRGARVLLPVNGG